MARTIIFFLGFLVVALVTPGTFSLEENTEVKENSAPCPESWLKYDDWCYKAFYEEKLLSWFEASLLCEVNHGHLAEPLTAGISDYLYEMAAVYEDVTGVSRWFLGLSDMGLEGNWRGPFSGETPQTSFWGSGKPNMSYNSLDCAVMTLDNEGYYWEDIGCVLAPAGETVAPLCQRKICPEGYTDVYNNHCYMVGGAQLTYQSAEAYCREMDGHLASVHSEGENEFIRGLAGGFYRWLGAILLDDSTNPWTWSWSDGSDFSYTGTWASSEPNAGDSRIVMVSDGKWAGVTPTFSGYPVCKL